MIVDCDRCEVRAEDTCRDCVVSVLLGTPPAANSTVPNRPRSPLSRPPG
ncbi:hypothetical protein ACFQV2_09525 [Actinokineospora soli]|uniref:Uncharacterized protein n=1 Tax=Actinokineospora soli TaxID=1048753 RepID=A0ABW2TJ43_9PSEU